MIFDIFWILFGGSVIFMVGNAVAVAPQGLEEEVSEKAQLQVGMCPTI